MPRDSGAYEGIAQIAADLEPWNRSRRLSERVGARSAAGACERLAVDLARAPSDRGPSEAIVGHPLACEPTPSALLRSAGDAVCERPRERLRVAGKAQPP